MLETEALQMWWLFLGSDTLYIPISQKNKTCALYHRVRWNLKWLPEDKSSSPLKCFSPKLPSKKTSRSNNLASQYPTFRCSMCVIPLCLVQCQQIHEWPLPSREQATHIWNPTSSLGPICLSSDTQISLFWYLFQGSQAGPERNYRRVLSFKGTAGGSEIHHTEKPTALQEELMLSEVCWEVGGKMGAEMLDLVRMEVLENIQSRSLATWETWILKM